jgi:DNA-binding transcriptional regulator YdaS (Cro superfamily)
MSRTRNRPVVFRAGHHAKLYPPIQKVGKWARNGIDRRIVLPELQMALRIHGEQKRVAALLGMSEGWMSAIVLGKIKRVRPVIAMRIAEVARGSRAETKEPAQVRANELTRERRNGRRLVPRCTCGRRASSEDVMVCQVCRNKNLPFPCNACPKSFASDHALYLHSRQVHGDATQGHHAWAGRHRAGVGGVVG